jgi:RND family efflux transporter MFP subunit
MSLRRSTIALILVATMCACDAERYQPATAIPVRSEAVHRGDFVPTTTLLGVVRASETIPLTALKSGRITYPRRFAHGLETGGHVIRGEEIAEIHNDQAVTARTQANLQMEAADADFERAQRSYDQGVVSKAEYSGYRVRALLAHEQYNAATLDARQMSIVAPSAGTLIVAKPFAPNVTVDAGTVIAQIAAGGAPIIESSGSAAQRDLLRPGQPVRFTVAGGRSGTGRITEVASVIDSSGTARVVSAIDAPGVPLPGSGVEMEVDLDRRADVLTVPESAIVAAADGPAVFIESTSEGPRRSRVKRVHVETGGRANGRVEIISGLRDGDRVIVAGADTLADDAVVQEAEASK